MQRVDASRHGTFSQKSQKEVMDFDRNESRIIGGTQFERPYVRAKKRTANEHVVKLALHVAEAN